MLTQDILHDPVDLEIAEWLAIPASNYGKGVAGFEICFEERFLCADRAVAAPEFGDAGDVHPFVEELEIGHGCYIAFGWRARSAGGS